MATTSTPTTDPISKSISEPIVHLQDMEELKKVFSSFDANGDDQISVFELDNVLKSLGSGVSKSHVELVMKHLDKDKKVFSCFDANGDGQISVFELDNILKSLGLGASKSQLELVMKDLYKDKKVVNRFNTNGDSQISVFELDNDLKSLGLSVSKSQLELVMKDLDKDNDGFINLSEFADFCCFNFADGNSTELRDTFDLCDQNKDNFIFASELHQLLNRLGLKCSVEECKNMIKSVDSDGDGSVNFEEFKKMMTNNPLSASTNNQ